MLSAMADFVRFDGAHVPVSVWINPDNVAGVTAPDNKGVIEKGVTLVHCIGSSILVKGEPHEVVRDLRDRRGD